MTHHFSRIASIRSLIVLLTAIFLLLAFAPVALAAELSVEEAGSPAAKLLLMTMQVVFSALGVVAIWAARKGIQFFEAKLSVDIPNSTEQLMLAWADAGVDLAHEKSHQALKKHGKKLSGPDKLNIAISFVNSLAQEYKLPQKAAVKLEDYIEAKLGKKRGGDDPDPYTETP